MEIKRDFFLCACNSVEHQLIVTRLDDAPEVYVMIHLAKLGFFKRLWHAIKYVFGYRCRFGDFEEFIFSPEDADRLQSIVDHLKSSVEEQ